jgi:hypothetical protein
MKEGYGVDVEVKNDWELCFEPQQLFKDREGERRID